MVPNLYELLGFPAKNKFPWVKWVGEVAYPLQTVFPERQAWYRLAPTLASTLKDALPHN